jgi:hypothetical protein
MKRLFGLVVVVVLSGCGPVIGDPCTVASECGKGVCLTAPFAPGGLCSLMCTVDGAACPAGSTCVTHAISADTAGCMKSCTADADCRAGYVCRVEQNSATKVCVGTAGVP